MKRQAGGRRGACLLAALLAVAVRLAALEPGDPLFGTWVNPQYDGNSTFAARFILFPEGRELDFDTVGSALPEYEGRFAVVEAWVDADANHWYKTQGTSDHYPYQAARYEFFCLIMVNAAGTVLESVASEVDYPEELSPLGGAYGIYRRQE